MTIVSKALVILFYYNHLLKQEHKLNPRKHKTKNVARRLKGGRANGPLPSTFDTIYPINLKFGTYSELSFHFQLI